MSNQEFMSKANAAAMRTKAKLQERAQVKRVADLATEIRARLDVLVTKTYEVTNSVRRVEDGDTSAYKSYPAGAFGSAASDLDSLLQALATECEHLEGLRQAEGEAERLAQEFGDLARASGLFDHKDSPPTTNDEVPQAMGQYL